MNAEKLPLNSVKKFYFLNYFYILLECIEKYYDEFLIFDFFITLKQKNRLGESKYKKNIAEGDYLTEQQFIKYKYTFDQVVIEAKEYKLIQQTNNESYILTEVGLNLLNYYRKYGEAEANKKLFGLMERRYDAFRQIIEFLYKANNFKKGLLVLPSYSPSQLGFEKSSIRTGVNIIEYLDKVIVKFEEDFRKYLGNLNNSAYSLENLKKQKEKLLVKLCEADLFPDNPKDKYPPEKYNSITKRIRDFWITYFLQEVYGYKYSMNSFDIWTYRAKQIGIIHATEFYPNFSGRVVYPTSVIVDNTSKADFCEIYQYEDKKKIYSHEPSPNMERNLEKFVEHLFNAYVDLRRTYRSYFINIPPLREIVCYNLKISERLFEVFLTKAYKDNLEGKIKIRIALEVDRLPEETKAMYLKREPVIIDGKYKNIIAIDIAKGEDK